jgi:hypothetical protein
MDKLLETEIELEEHLRGRVTMITNFEEVADLIVDDTYGPGETLVTVALKNDTIQAQVKGADAIRLVNDYIRWLNANKHPIFLGQGTTLTDTNLVKAQIDYTEP